MHKDVLPATRPLLPLSASLSSLFTDICGSAAKLRGVFEAKFCSAHKHVSNMVLPGPVHLLVSRTFSHLDGIKIIYTVS